MNIGYKVGYRPDQLLILPWFPSSYFNVISAALIHKLYDSGILGFCHNFCYVALRLEFFVYLGPFTFFRNQHQFGCLFVKTKSAYLADIISMKTLNWLSRPLSLPPCTFYFPLLIRFGCVKASVLCNFSLINLYRAV